MTQLVDVLVVGAGQAGLAASWRLKRAGCSHLIVDASKAIGDSWRRRYQSLVLFTPRGLSALPGKSLAGDEQGYATRLEFADYLERYAESNELPVMSGTCVESLSAAAEGFSAKLDNGAEVRARSVIVCTGAFQQAVIPELSARFHPDLAQLTVSTYRSAISVGKGPVLIVGDGASGRDIAVDLAAKHPVILATGKRRRLFPQHVLGVSSWTWMDRLGLLSASPSSAIGKWMRTADPFPDRGRNNLSLRMRGIQIRPRLADASGWTATFADGNRSDVGTVIWAVGYRFEDAWIGMPNDTPGLYFLGRPWQRNRASGLILGAKRDSKVVVSSVLGYLGQP